MGVSMSTLTGWVIILALAGGYGYREWSNSQRAQLRQAASAQKTAKKVNKPKESKPKQATQGSDAKPKPKAAKAPAPAPAPAAQTLSYSSDDLEADRDRDAARNREFARQLSNAKQGTTFAKKTKEESRQKSVKQSRAEEAPVVAANAAADAGKVSAPSSTAGIDADDDSSSAATSPVLAATTQASAVDDMLEKSAPGPSVLRLTGTEEKPNYKTQKTKAPEVVESKKQRQNRKKAELAKAEREAAEADRKSKLEAQRRTARQAEGRAAKDGSAFMAAQASKSNAWTEAGSNGSNGKTASTGTKGFVPVQPLDTYDANAVQTNASKSSVPSYDKNEDWVSSLPSEEEQMEILRKDQSEDSWNTVTKSRKTKNNKESAAPAAEAPAAAAAPVAAKVAPVAAAAAAPAPVAQKQRPAAVASQSSFAALAVENPTEELQEEEWDV